MRWRYFNLKLNVLALACTLTVGCSMLQQSHAHLTSPTTVDKVWYLDHSEVISADKVESPRRLDALRILSSWQWDEPYWLHSIPGANEVYRLYYKPSLYNESIVRVVRIGKVWTLAVRTQDSRIIKRLQDCVLATSQKNPINCPLERPVVDYERRLSPQEVASLKPLLQRLNFWRLPSNIKTTPLLDGIDWILEGFDTQHQVTHRVTRENPTTNSAFYRFGDYLLKIGKVQRY